MKYNLSRIAEICNGTLRGGDRTVEGISTDSRNSAVGGDSLFVAIAGRNHDGHQFIKQLYEQGWRSFMVERWVEGVFPYASFVKVDNAVDALQALASDYRSGFAGKVVGITGSNGKTVVKEWIAQMMPPEVKLFRSPRSYNSQIGVPLSILMMDLKEDIALIEAGISTAGEMEKLQRVIRPDIGIITTLGEAHQDGFSSIEEKLDEKLKLFEGTPTVLYNSAYPEIGDRLRRMEPPRKLIDARVNEPDHHGFSDRASRENAAMAITLCRLLAPEHMPPIGQNDDLLHRLSSVAMRLEVKEGLSGSLIVNDSYNSDINSLGIALDYLANVCGGRPRMVVLSDILQSGMTGADLYGRVARMLRDSGVASVVGVGGEISRYSHLFDIPARFFPTTESYMADVDYLSIEGQAILLKGNRAAGFERLDHAFALRTHTTTLEVDLDAMVHNLNWHRAKLAHGTRIMAMVKASSYGHGTFEVAQMLQHEGVSYLAVAFADEGVLLRRRGITMPIVVLNADAGSFDLMVAHRLEPEIYNYASLEDFCALLRRYSETGYPIHIKLDTGMHRLGFDDKQIYRLTDLLEQNSKLLRVRSLFSHLAAADEPRHDDFTRIQISNFESMSVTVMAALKYPVLRHIANSAGIERFPEAAYDMCRLGIGLYGVGSPELRPVGRLMSRIVQVKRLAAGESVGYGRDTVLQADTRLAVVPIGYADGLDRHLGEGHWAMEVNGKPAPTVGRVCMDTCMIDVTDIEAAEGDRVTIYGGDGDYSVSAVARQLGTIPYEVMTRIDDRVKRVYLKE